MPPANVVSLVTVRDFVVAQLNAADTYGGAVDDPKYPQGLIDAVILNADAIVVKAIMENDKHPKRGVYLVATAVNTSGNLLPEHLGPIGEVKNNNLPCTMVAIGDFRRWLRSASIFIVPTAPGVAATDAERLYFNDSSVTVDLCTYNRTGACQAPIEYTTVEAHLAAAMIFKLGGDGNMAGHHLKLALLELSSMGEAMSMTDYVLKHVNKE